MKKERVFALTILALIIMPLMVGLVSAAATFEWKDLGGSSVFEFLKYIFGEIPSVTDNIISAAIITIAITLLIILTFGDIIATFSTFSAWVSWLIAILIGVVLANLGAIHEIIVGLTVLFTFAGAFAIYIALGAALVAFLAVNLGIWRLRTWIIKRRAMMHAAKAKAGGYRIAGAIEGLKEIGEAEEKAAG